MAIHWPKSKAMKKKVKSKKMQLERIAVCEQCPWLIASIRRCRQCGCKVEDRAKMVDKGCPVNRWPGDFLN